MEFIHNTILHLTFKRKNWLINEELVKCFDFYFYLLLFLFYRIYQACTTDELPEKLIGAVRVSHLELSSAIVPILESESAEPSKS